MARTRSDKRRARKARGINRDLAAAGERATASIPAEPQEDPRCVVIGARTRQNPGAKDVEQNVFGDDAGRAIAKLSTSREEADALWKAFCEMDVAHAVFMSRIIGRTRHAAVSRFEMVRERVEASASDRIDLRTEDQRNADARARWGRWDRRLRLLTAAERIAIKAAMLRPETLIREGRPTTTGEAFVMAMRIVRSAA